MGFWGVVLGFWGVVLGFWGVVLGFWGVVFWGVGVGVLVSTRVSNEHNLSHHLYMYVESVEAHKAGITLFATDCWSTAAHHCFQRLVAAAFAASSSSNSFAFAAAFGAAAAAARPPFSCQ